MAAAASLEVREQSSGGRAGDVGEARERRGTGGRYRGNLISQAGSGLSSSR